jgi:hypothetical protein
MPRTNLKQYVRGIYVRIWLPGVLWFAVAFLVFSVIAAFAIAGYILSPAR